MRDKNLYYGRDCPKGMVQVEFVGCQPETKRSEYGWKPCVRTFVEIYVDGKRFRIDVGDFYTHDGSKRRGIHINFPIQAGVDKVASNALDIFLPDEE